METYLTLLYVTLEQELAMKDFFIEKGWTYCKPDLSVMTDKVGPVSKPHSIKTKNGGIIMYSQLPGNDKLPGVVTDKAGKRGRKKKEQSQDFTEVKIEIPEQEANQSQLGSDTCELVLELDDVGDGDNDDDYADELVTNTLENEALDNDKIDPKVDDPTRIRDRKHVADMVKSVYGTRSRSRNILKNVRQENESLDHDKTSVSRTWKRKAEVKTDDLEEVKKGRTSMTRTKMKKPERKDPVKKLTCNICSKQYSMQHNLDKHFKLAHNPDNPPKKKLKRKPICRQCDICGAFFSRSDYLLNHKRIVHLGIKRKVPPVFSTCEICGSTFKRRDHLKEHILVKHSNSKLPYQCNLCEKTFIRPGGRELHVNRDHLNVKPYECTYCNKKFFATVSLKKHTNSQVCQPNRVHRFKCIRCEKTFLTSSNLEMHMTAVHFGGAYTCVCGEVVRWSGSIAKHKRKCKAYQEYVAVNGELEDKLCNIIEVPYSDVLISSEVDDSSIAAGMVNVQTEVNKLFEEDNEQNTEQSIKRDNEPDIEQDSEQELEHDTEQVIEGDPE